MTSFVSPISSWSLRTKKIDFSTPPVWMGIINLTTDSFSDGGLFCQKIDEQRIQLDIPAIIDYALTLIEQGAEIIDIGGESSRPGSEPISELEEIQRVIPVIQRLAKKTNIPISVDTTRSSVAELAILAGAEIINDISGGTFDPKMLNVIRKYQPGYCLMHIQGRPKTMQFSPVYQNVVEDVFFWLKERLTLFLDAGIPQNKICLDVGIGFGKTLEQNIELLRNIERFYELGCPVLVGHSRKSFLNAFCFQNKWRRNDQNVSVPSSFSLLKNSISDEVILKKSFFVNNCFETKVDLIPNISLRKDCFKSRKTNNFSKSITSHLLSDWDCRQEINVSSLGQYAEKYIDSVQLNSIRDDWTALLSMILARKNVHILRVHNIQKNQMAVNLDRIFQGQE